MRSSFAKTGFAQKIVDPRRARKQARAAMIALGPSIPHGRDARPTIL